MDQFIVAKYVNYVSKKVELNGFQYFKLKDDLHSKKYAAQILIPF